MTQGAEVMSWAQQRISELEAENASLREGLLAACEAAYHRMCVLHPHDGGCGWNTDNPLPTLLRDAINKARALSPRGETVQESEG